MTDSIQWRVPAQQPLPDEFLSIVRQFLEPSSAPDQGTHAAQLLWQRGIREPQSLLSFLDPRRYQPTHPLTFGPEMEQAVKRLQQAHRGRENLVIWSDTHPDGLVAAALLADGLREFLANPAAVLSSQSGQHNGLLQTQWMQLAAQGYKLLILCNVGPIDPVELHAVQTQGLDVIVIDAHCLPVQRLPVVAQLMPRTLPTDHPFRPLASVAVAYKLVEALFESLPEVPQRSLDRLLDLVAVGLLADRVQLTGECRYLAQRGIAVLQRNQDPVDPPRPGVAKLLELCRRSGDRPTDISFGLAPRIQAISQLQEDTQSVIELLTNQNRERCDPLAREAELAYTRRKALQRTVVQQVREQLVGLDRSTTAVIVLADESWPFGILGFAASQIAQEYGRPTLLLTLEANSTEAMPIACGVARSAQPLDFADLLHPQSHLLHRVSGHPQAVALSLPAENLSLLTKALNQQLRLHPLEHQAALQPDLVVTVADLGQSLFQELKLLEPCGMGNPVPRLLIQNGWFTSTWHRKIQDLTGRKLEYLKTEFELRDDSCAEGFPGVWWGHYKDELPLGRCDVIVELDFNSYKDARRSRRYEVRLIAVRPHQAVPNETAPLRLFDQRGQSAVPSPSGALVVHHCPCNWTEFQRWCQQADQMQCSLVLAYALPALLPPIDCWQQLVELANSLSRTQQPITTDELQQRLGLGQQSLTLGLKALSAAGFRLTDLPQGWQVSGQPTAEAKAEMAAFLQTVQEEQFMQQYFMQAPLAVLQTAANRTVQTAS